MLSEGEANFTRYVEPLDDRNGKPPTCTFQAGFYQCDTNMRYVSERWNKSFGWYWSCPNCGQVFRSKRTTEDGVLND